MPYAKTSMRAEQQALRARMLELGLSARQVAWEFGRRYGLRPRQAWRHARGWSLKEAAEHITAYAAHVGLNPAGATVAMTGPHLSETENWPGYGQEPSGRRPTPYLLSLLAATYDCAVTDLLDVADYQHMRPADRLILDQTITTPGGNGVSQSAAGRVPAAVRSQPGPLPVSPRSQPPQGPTGGQAVGGEDVAISASGLDVGADLAPLARALLSPPTPAEVVPGRLAEQANGLWRLRQQARYRKLAAGLPAVLTRARSGELALAEDRSLASVLTHLYNAASSLAKMLGSAELAGIAADRAVRAAALTGDPLLNAAAAYRLANVLLAAGQPEPAQAVAIRAADQLRPVLTASPSHTATWGALIATSALAATQTAADADARELLGAAKVAADLLATEHADLFAVFGPANWLIHAVHVAAALGDGATAVTRAHQIPVTRLPGYLAERRTWLLIGTARGHALRGDLTAAALALLDADHLAPEELRRNPDARTLLATLHTASTIPNQALNELDTRLHAPAGNQP
jgi:hypothetical protein